MQTGGAGHGSDGALSSWLHFMLPVGKRETLLGLVVQDCSEIILLFCFFFAANVKVIFPIS